jgi:hypothetical protein
MCKMMGGKSCDMMKQQAAASQGSSMCKMMGGKGCDMMKAGAPMTETMPMTHTMPMTSSMPMTETATSAAVQPAQASSLAPQTAEAGAVTVTVTPHNLNDPDAQTLDFDIALNTHSVDLSDDPSKLATLRAGAAQVAAVSWNAPAVGGHHVSGVLSFPAVDAQGRPLLQNASRIVLNLRNLAGVPLRMFMWTLPE